MTGLIMVNFKFFVIYVPHILASSLLNES